MRGTHETASSRSRQGSAASGDAGAVRRRLAAAGLALAAGALGLLVAATLLRSLPSLTAAASPPTRPVGPETSLGPAPAGFPAPPPRAVVFAAEAGQEALGLAVVRGTRRLSLQASLVDGNGAGTPNLHVGFVIERRHGRATVAPARACGRGCYRASAAISPPPSRVFVSIGRRRPERVAFVLPGAWPLRPATSLVVRAARVWRALRTLVFHDELSSGGAVTVHTLWMVVAPDRLSYRVHGGEESVLIGGRRWTRFTSGGRWQLTPQFPVRQPLPAWVSVRDAYVLGATSVAGRPAWHISFFDPATPGWFSILLDEKSFHTLDVRMIAAAHFMHDRYGPFDAPLSIVPPSTAR